MKNDEVTGSYIGISGEPGSGKSFLSTILSREYLKKDILCFTISLQRVRVSKKLSLVKFLHQNSTIDFYPEESDLESLKYWLKYNQKRLVVVLDGLDQLKGEIILPDELPDIDCEESSSIWLGYLMGRKILKKSKLFVTSRTLAFIALNGELQPTENYSLYDFDDSRVLKVLKFCFANKADELFNKIKENDVLSIAKHPMSAFLIGNSYIEENFDLTDVTMYLLYLRLFEKFHCKTNVAGTRKPNLDVVMRKVEEISYHMILKDQYIVTSKLIEGYEQVTLKDFENVLMIDAGGNGENSYEVDDNEKVVVFNHQIQLVSACLIC